MIKNLNLQTAKQKFIKHLEQKNRSSSTIIAYNKDLEQLFQFMHKTEDDFVQNLKEQHIKNFKENLFENKYTAKSISRKLNSIKTFCRFLLDQKYIENNPAINIEHPKYEVKPPRILSKMEYRSLRDVCRNDIRIFAIIEILLQTGIRIGELSNIKLNNIQDNKLIIHSYESQPERQVPFNNACKQALAEYLKIRPKTSCKNIFITKTGHKFLVRNIRSALKRYFKKSGIKNVKVNDLRHTFIAHQLKAGTPLTLISKLVGHKRISTTEKYLNILDTKQTIPETITEL